MNNEKIVVKKLIQEEVEYLRFEIDGVGENGTEKKHVSLDFVKYNREGLTPVFAVFVNEENQASKSDLWEYITAKFGAQVRRENLHPTQIISYVVNQDKSVDQAHFGVPEFGTDKNMQGWIRLADKSVEIGDLEQAIAKGLTSNRVQVKALDLEKESVTTTQGLRDDFKKTHNIS